MTDRNRKYMIFMGGFLLVSAAAALLMYAADPAPEPPPASRADPQKGVSSAADIQESRQESAPSGSYAAEAAMRRGNCISASFSGDQPAEAHIADIGALPSAAESEAVGIVTEGRGVLRFRFAQHFHAPDGNGVLLLQMKERRGYPVLTPVQDAIGQDGTSGELYFTDIEAGVYLLADGDSWMRQNPNGDERGQLLRNEALGFDTVLLPRLQFTEQEITAEDAAENLADADDPTDTAGPAYYDLDRGTIHVLLADLAHTEFTRGLISARIEWVSGEDMDTAAQEKRELLRGDENVSILRSERITSYTGSPLELVQVRHRDTSTDELTAFCPLEGNQYIMLRYRYDSADPAVVGKYASALWESCREYRRLQ